MLHGNFYNLIHRFYKKADLERNSALTAEERQFMADAEVFEVNSKSRITSKQITGKCYVWTIEEYDEEPRVGLDVYYTRGKYDLFLVFLSCYYRKLLIHLLVLGKRYALA